MSCAIRNGATALVLLGGVAFAVFHYGPAPVGETVGIAPSHAAVDDYFEGDITGSIGRSASAGIDLSEEQRGFVFLGVINLPDVPDADIAAPRLADVLPDEVVLRNIPAMVRRQIPELAAYRFVKLDDRILLVGAENRRVVAAIPRYKLMVR